MCRVPSLASIHSTSLPAHEAINLGTGLDGGEANNATDENLRLIAQLPEVERVMVYKGKFTADGLALLTALPKLRYLQMYSTDVPAAASPYTNNFSTGASVEFYRVRY